MWPREGERNFFEQQMCSLTHGNLCDLLLLARVLYSLSEWALDKPKIMRKIFFSYWQLEKRVLKHRKETSELLSLSRSNLHSLKMRLLALVTYRFFSP